MKKFVNHISGCALAFGLLLASHSLASELTVPNQFSSGDVTSANDMNANFAAIEAAVNDNHARIQEGLQSQSRPVFVGFSTEQVLGNSGFNSWQQACHNTSAGSHVCTDVELSAAPYNPEAPIPDEAAWINVEIQAATVTTSSQGLRLSPKIQGCNNSGLGYYISNGSVSVSSCTETKPIACCK